MMVPGAPNPLLAAGGGDPIDEFFKITNSLRVRSSATAYAARTFGTPTDSKKWTASFWVKRGIMSASANFAMLDASNTTDMPGPSARYNYLSFANDSIQWFIRDSSQVIQVNLKTNAVFRDATSHLHVVISFDSANATSTLRALMTINGVPITSFSASTYPVLNFVPQFNNAGVHNIGRDQNGGTSPLEYFDGYLSRVEWVDGQVLPATAFGAFHPTTGQWRPRRYTGSYGNNGFLLDFSDGSSTTNLFLDRSGNGNNWTPNNFSVSGSTNDCTLDTPTTNYCTIDPAFTFNYTRTFANGNLQMTSTPMSAICTLRADLSASYWEAIFSVKASGVPTIGFFDRSGTYSSQYIGYGSTGVLLNAGSNLQTGLPTYTNTDVISCTVDPTTNLATWRKNNVVVTTFTLPAGHWYPFANGGGAIGTDTCIFNFGQIPFAYTPPAGYAAICAKNLPFPTIPKAANGFVAVADTGANITTSLPAASSSFASWLRIYKRRDAVSAWVWNFSNDPTNCLDSSSSNGKAAFPALVSGGNYIGYAINLAGTYGAASGVISHTNGVADTITHNLGRSRNMVILKREDAASNWFIFHPDVTAGKLLYMSNAAETTDASINTVTSNSFVIDSTVATGTYRWIVLGDTSGFFRLGKYTGTNNADGPIVTMGFAPKFNLTKRCDAATDNWDVWDRTREPNNIMSLNIFPSTTAAESASSGNDAIGSGFKVRNTALNISAARYVTAHFSEFPMRYANAR